MKVLVTGGCGFIGVTMMAGGTSRPITPSGAMLKPLRRTMCWSNTMRSMRVWGKPPRLRISGGQHQAGTCRMGDDPQTSVVDRNCRVHGYDNLYIADGSVHVTNGGFNPVLTIMALAFRTAEHVAQAW